MKNKWLIPLVLAVAIHGQVQIIEASDVENRSKEAIEQKAEVASRVEEVIFNSKELGKEMKMNVYLPKGYDETKKYPALYLLHGFQGDRGIMEEYQVKMKADELIASGEIDPMIIVTPDLNNSFALNSAHEYHELKFKSMSYPIHIGPYEDYLRNEVVNYIDEHYSTIKERSGRYIGGLSMGGYGALRIGFSNQDLFSKVGGHAPALFTTDMDFLLKMFLYPSKGVRAQRDPIDLAKKIDFLEDLKVYLDCGTKDEFNFDEGVKVLAEILTNRNVDHIVKLEEGGHDPNYHQERIKDYLKFYGAKEEIREAKDDL